MSTKALMLLAIVATLAVISSAMPATDTAADTAAERQITAPSGAEAAGDLEPAASHWGGGHLGGGHLGGGHWGGGLWGGHYPVLGSYWGGWPYGGYGHGYGYGGYGHGLYGHHGYWW